MQFSTLGSGPELESGFWNEHPASPSIANPAISKSTRSGRLLSPIFIL
jgi:hypothetical protein